VGKLKLLGIASTRSILPFKVCARQRGWCGREESKWVVSPAAKSTAAARELGGGGG